MYSDYPFSGKLIDGVMSYQWLLDSIPRLEGEALLCSAFLKANILEEFHRLTPPGAKVRVLSRWQLGDLIVGASDIEAYQLCKKFDWEFYVRLDFHGKVFFVPNNGILVGSANATSSGFGLRPKSNSEVGTVVRQTDENIRVIEDLFSSAIKINDILFEELRVIVEANQDDREKINWPRNVLSIIEKKDYSFERFFLSECMQTNGVDIFEGNNLKAEDVISDLSLLGLLGGRFSRELVVELFISSKIYRWVYSTLAKNEGSLSFGGLTAALHSSLLEDPAPYRKEVKRLVQNIYSWIRLSGSKSTGIEILQPNHSEILKII